MEHSSDRNLLFGVLALQLDFIQRDDLVRGMNAWVMEKHQGLGRILVDQGVLAADAHELLESLVNKHLTLHGDDAARSLAAVGAGALRDELSGITDPEMQTTLSRPPGDAERDQYATVAHQPGNEAAGKPRYRTLRALARGGMGQVAVALDLELQREVVLKEILNQLADHPQSRQRFLVEARITGGLEHPGVVSVYGLCQHPDGRPYYAMRFIRGRSLKEEIEHCHQSKEKWRAGDRPRTLRRLLKHFLDVCNAVEYAHSRGILHRDLKPANVMLGAYGETLVVDWGLAKPFDQPARQADSGPGPLRIEPVGDSTATMMGAVVGTPQYMSPEQAAGQLDRLGPASDVYSLGATLFHVLTGQAPVQDKDTAAVLHKVQQGNFPAPRQVKRDIPRVLEAICLKAMSLRPDERYPAPRALAQDLELWLADEPTSVASVEGVVERSGRWLRKHRTAVASAVVLLVTAVVALSLSNAFIAEARDHARDQWVQAEAARKEAAARAEAERFANERLVQALYFNRIALVERELASNNVPRAQELLNACRDGASSWEWQYLQRRIQDPEPFHDSHDRDRIMSMAYSPDGNQVASGGLSGTIRVWDALTGKVVKSFQPGMASSASALSFARDGRLAVAFSAALSEATIKIYESSNTAKEVVSFVGPTGVVSHLDFSPDGRWLALGASNGQAHIHDTATGKEVLVLRGHDRPLRCVDFDSKGRRLATCGDDNLIRVWELPSGKLLRTLEGHIAEVLSVAFSPDDTKLASSSMIGNIRIWDAATGTSLLEFSGDCGPIHQVAFHPDGTRLASANYDRSVKLWDTATGQEVLALRGHDDDASCVAFSPDGSCLASASWDGHLHFYDARPLNDKPRYQLFNLKGHQRRVYVVRYHPDGRRVYSGSSDGTIHAWDAETGRLLATLKGHAGMVISLDVSGDGKQLLTACATGHLHIWDIEAGTLLRTHRNLKSTVWGAAFNRDATWIACISGFDGSISIYDAQTGKEIRTTQAHAGGAFGLSYSADGKHLASGGFDRTAKVFDASTGKLLHTFSGHTNAIHKVAFSRDGSTLATASADKTVRLWDLKLGKEIMVLRGHTDRVHDVELSPDGSTVVTTGADGVVRVWRTVDGKETATLRGQDGIVVDAHISPDGRRLASSFGFRESGGIIIWDLAAIVADSKKGKGR